MLTPHAGELGRLLGATPARSRAAPACRRSRGRGASGAIVVLKGDDTIVADGERPSGDQRAREPGLATAGTGDVLSGIIAALLARGLEPCAAACAAV